MKRPKLHKNQNRITLVGLSLFFIVGIFFLFNFTFFDQSRNSNTGEFKTITKEEALELIASASLIEKKEIPKEVWLQSDVLNQSSYKIVWKHGTERPYSSPLNDEKREGIYVSKACGVEVFSSEHKYDSGTGWPSFTHPINESNVILKKDYSLGIPRTEVLSKCGEHLGHVFNDGPKNKGGKRWCINGEALEFIPKEE